MPVRLAYCNFTVPGILAHREAVANSCLRVVDVSVEEMQWEVWFYPNGHSAAKPSESRQVFFEARRVGDPVHLSVGMGIGWLIIHPSDPSKSACQFYNSKQNGMQRNMLRDRGTIPWGRLVTDGFIRTDGSVNVQLEIALYEGKRAAPPKRSYDGRFSDCSLHCPSGTVFPSHKVLLVDHSPYLNSLFTGNFAESKSGQVDIKLDVSDLTVKSFLRYVYEDWVPSHADKPREEEEEPVEEPKRKRLKRTDSLDDNEEKKEDKLDVVQLFQFADFYQVVPLATACVKVLDAFLTPASLFPAIAFAKKLKDDIPHHKAFRAAVEQYISKNPKALLL